MNYRNFFLVTSGILKIRLAAPNNTKHLHPEKDYDIFEFRSQINPWDVHDKLKTIEITLVEGKIINIPPYWWYSFKFDKDTTVASFQYRTYMNNASILPDLMLYVFQQHNIKRETVKKLEVVEVNNDKKVNNDKEDKEEITEDDKKDT
jgi:hypothetical protein